MDIDITNLVINGETWPLSGSVATHGPNAARSTWEAAKAEAEDSPLLRTDDELQAMRDWAKATGAWDDTEIAAWSDTELNALFLQLVTSDMREMGLEDSTPEDFDWDAYQAEAEAGKVGGSIFRSADRIYYSLEG